MIYLQRKIKARFNGSVDYLPEGIPADKFLPVIGFEVRRRNYQKTPESKIEVKEDLYYHVINNAGKLVPIASFNMQTMIDERAEIDAVQATEILRNITIMGKMICEKFNEKHPDTGTNGGKGGGGKNAGKVG